MAGRFVAEWSLINLCLGDVFEATGLCGWLKLGIDESLMGIGEGGIWGCTLVYGFRGLWLDASREGWEEDV